MKRLISICCAMLLLGTALTIGGLAAGGNLALIGQGSSVFQLHPTQLNPSASDHPFVTNYFVPARLDDEPVNELAFSLNGSHSFTLCEGEDFAVSGTLMPLKNQIQDGAWHLEFSEESTSGETVRIFLPATAFEDISCFAQHATLSIETTLTADEIELIVQNGSATASLLSGEEIDLQVEHGSLEVTLDGIASAYDLEALTHNGEVLLNNTQIANQTTHVTLAENTSLYELNCQATDGQIILHTASEETPT